MAISFKIYGNADNCPSVSEIIDFLEESDFDITIESEDEEEDAWEELYVFESSIDCAIDVVRYDGEDEVLEEVRGLLRTLSGSEDSEETLVVKETLRNHQVIFGVELPEEAEDDDNALVMCSILAQYLAHRTDGIYCVDGEGFFDESGDLILELADVD